MTLPSPLRDSEPGAESQRAGFPLTQKAILTAYRRMAPVYDWMFGPVLEPGRRSVIAALAAQPGERVLEVGVGTGLSLPHWPATTEVTGVDISAPMLARAERRRQRRRLTHVTLREMDAQALAFPDNHFDKVAVMYVVSVVENLPALLAEVSRVCKPGGQIAIINHFANPHPRLRRLEGALSRYAGVIGFHPAMTVDAVAASPRLTLLDTRPANWLGYWTLLVATPRKEAA